MDFTQVLRHGAKVVIGLTALFLLDSFFRWEEIDVGIASAGRSMWYGVGVIAGVAAIGLLAWEVLRLVNIDVKLPVGRAMVSFGLSVVLVVFAAIRFLTVDVDRTLWAWIGVALAIAIVVMAFGNLRESEESFEDLRSLTGGGGAAAASEQAAPPASGGGAESASTDVSEAVAGAEESVAEATDDVDRPAG